jgi:hypothetical protein
METLTINDLKQALKQCPKIDRIIRIILNSKAYQELLEEIRDRFALNTSEPLKNEICKFDSYPVRENCMLPNGVIALEYADKFTVVDMNSGKSFDTKKVKLFIDLPLENGLENFSQVMLSENFGCTKG